VSLPVPNIIDVAATPRPIGIILSKGDDSPCIEEIPSKGPKKIKRARIAGHPQVMLANEQALLLDGS